MRRAALHAQQESIQVQKGRVCAPSVTRAPTQVLPVCRCAHNVLQGSGRTSLVRKHVIPAKLGNTPLLPALQIRHAFSVKQASTRVRKVLPTAIRATQVTSPAIPAVRPKLSVTTGHTLLKKVPLRVPLVKQASTRVHKVLPTAISAMRATTQAILAVRAKRSACQGRTPMD